MNSNNGGVMIFCEFVVDNDITINCIGPKKPGPHMYGVIERESMVSEKKYNNIAS